MHVCWLELQCLECRGAAAGKQRQPHAGWQAASKLAAPWVQATILATMTRRLGPHVGKLLRTKCCVTGCQPISEKAPDVLQVAVITKFPQLVDLQGPAKINQTDIDSIMGFTGGWWGAGESAGQPAGSAFC